VAKLEEIAAIDRFVDRRRQKDANVDISDLEQERAQAEEALRSLRTAHRILFTAKTLLPKPEETVALVERWIVDAANLRSVAPEDGDDEPSQDTLAKRRRGRGSSFGSVRARESDVLEAVRRERDARSATWIVGTSLAFEGVLLLLGCASFSRRDF
jgi:hypothetical protein